MRLRRTILLPVLLLAVALLALPAASQARHRAVAHKGSSRVLVGVANADANMFLSPFYTQLHTKITRYIAPYNTAVSPTDLAYARAYINAAQAQGVQVMVAFYHARIPRSAALKMPSVSAYTKDIKLFMKDFPQVKVFQPWNEANRGKVSGLFASPTASQSAAYYAALRKACPHCTNVGLDVLDQANIRPTLTYIRQFKHDVSRLHIPLPSVWGLHNYSDTNRFSSSRTRAVLAAVPGQVWLTETGGIVQFGRAFPNSHGSGLTRASKALTYMFRLSKLSSRIKRLYIFNWQGADPTERFDAGLVDARGVPRPGYVVVCKALHAPKCSGFALARD